MKTNQPRMHASFYVSDLHKTTSFYNSFFDTLPVKEKPGYTKYVLNSPALVISFIENPDKVNSNFGHLGFQVESEEALNLSLWRAKKEQLVTLEETGTSCCYAKQDKYWVTDPDGVQWEVYYFHEDSEFNDPKYELNEAAACCMPSDKTNLALKDLTPSNNCC
jgi:catechol 2,3-dioxygenase-like lactoylglutathione lyase family enzyme